MAEERRPGAPIFESQILRKYCLFQKSFGQLRILLDFGDESCRAFVPFCSQRMANRAQAAPFDPLSFLKLMQDQNSVELSCGAHPEDVVNCPKRSILAAPSEKEQNFATEDFGATVRVSSCIWGSGPSGKEKLQNVLRLVLPALSPLSHCIDSCPTSPSSDGTLSRSPGCSPRVAALRRWRLLLHFQRRQDAGSEPVDAARSGRCGASHLDIRRLAFFSECCGGVCVRGREGRRERERG
jgi:hypothetical protein